MTATPTAITKILDWQRAHQGELVYSQTDPGRLDYSDAGMLRPTDCSGLIAKLFQHFAGVYIGTYTGNECDFGERITTDKDDAAAARGMLPGDCILFNWWFMPDGPWNHIAMYAGNGRIWNHGGPDRGPQDWNLASNVWNARRILVRRFLPWTADTPEPTPTPQGDDVDEHETRKIAQEVVANALKALRGGNDAGHWDGDGPDAGFNDRLTRLENAVGIDKHGAKKKG